MKERVLRIVGDNRKDAVILSVYASSVRNGLLDLRTLPHIIESLEHFGKRFPTGEDVLAIARTQQEFSDLVSYLLAGSVSECNQLHNEPVSDRAFNRQRSQKF